MMMSGWVRKSRAICTLCLLAITLAACGGGDDSKPTPTTAAQPAPSPTATTASTSVPTAASPVASPVTSPLASPVAGFDTRPISREEFKAQLAAAYPMEPAAAPGGKVIMGESGDISTLNPILANDTTTINVVGTMFETLVGLSPIDGRVVPVLADSWEVSPDGLVYTFHLNQQATWHDGVDLTAEDVKFSFDAVLDPNTGSTYTTTVNQAVKSYRVVDADTFEITAEDRLVTFLSNGPGSVFIMPKHIWESVDFSSWSFDGGSTGQDPARVVGSGPFKFKVWEQGNQVTVARNDAHYDTVPTIDEFTLLVQPDAEASVLALEAGQTDIMYIIPPAQTQSVAEHPQLEVEIYNFPQITLYAMNLDAEVTPLFQDVAVRQALLVGLNRDSITQDIYYGYGEAAIGTQPQVSPAYAPDLMNPKFSFDAAAATQMLADAGWVDSNDNGTLDKDGVEMKFRLLYSGGDATVEQLVAYMQSEWAKIGVEVELESVEGNLFLDRLRAHDFDMSLLAFSFTPDGDQGILFTCDAYRNGFNFMRYCNSRYDELDALQRREFDPQLRANYLIEQSQIVWQEQPVGPIRFGVARTGYNIRLHNFYPNGYGLLWSLPYIWVDQTS